MTARASRVETRATSTQGAELGSLRIGGELCIGASPRTASSNEDAAAPRAPHAQGQRCAIATTAAYYPRFKRVCDEYFFLKHRGEARRGVGGLFFENLDAPLEQQLPLVEDCGNAFLPAYLPIVERRKATTYTPAQREWQELRRGRYVEFNLVYDRGASGSRRAGRSRAF